MTLLASSTNLVVISEVLDATIETFADGPCVDQVLQSTNLFALLKSVQQTLRQKMRISRKELGENIGLVDMARVNLNRFITYKETSR